MKELAEHAWFLLCRGLGRTLRSARYSRTTIVLSQGELEVWKRRIDYAPLLLWVGNALLKVLHTGVRVLPRQEWHARERQLHQRLRGASIRVDDDGTLVLPCLPGQTLAALLEDRDAEVSSRRRAIELAVVALSELHRQGFTHGDAMAENVMVDLEAGRAHWFDFETVHDEDRGVGWCRTDDVRALLATCLVRTDPEEVAEVLAQILNVHRDEAATRLLRRNFHTVFQRPLAFHLGQAGLSRGCFREVDCLLTERLGE